MFCGNCGKPLNEGALFCPECGTPVKKIETENVNVEETTASQAQPNNIPIRNYDPRFERRPDGNDRRTDRPGVVGYRQRVEYRCRTERGQYVDGEISVVRLVERQKTYE
jgi:uncharacterized Zn finger protein (UPF0148 family)